jgi:pyruvate kinase
MQKTATKHTKIVATIGPATETKEIISDLISAGMNVARFNTKHGTPEWHLERIKRVREVAAERTVPIGILLDLQGPEIRINTPTPDGFMLEAQDEVVVGVPGADLGERSFTVPDVVIATLEPGDTVSIDDGIGEFAVVSKNGNSLVCQALSSFPVKNRKTLNTPGVIIDLPSLIENDIAFLDALQPGDVDFIGLSFVRNAQDIEILRSELSRRDLSIAVMAKIENQSALDNIHEIISTSDAVMVARGDLAVEVPFEELAYWQKMIIKECRKVAKPVITATQMLKSMVEAPRPTRAEVIDVSTAVYDGTDAVMLSEETTIGAYPIKTVETQARIVRFNEPHARFEKLDVNRQTHSEDIAHAAYSLLRDLENPRSSLESPVRKIVCLTETGRTAKLLARYRPDATIYALTSNQRTYQELALVHSVEPKIVSLEDGAVLEQTESLKSQMQTLGIVDPGETVLYIHGIFWKDPGKTNTLSLVTFE